MMSRQVKVARIPNCDITTHPPRKAYADARLPHDGRWAYVCKPCFGRFGCSLGTGHGQELLQG